MQRTAVPIHLELDYTGNVDTFTPAERSKYICNRQFTPAQEWE